MDNCQQQCLECNKVYLIKTDGKIVGNVIASMECACGGQLCWDEWGTYTEKEANDILGLVATQ